MPPKTAPIQAPIDNSPELEALLFITKENGETQEQLLETSIVQNEKNTKEVKETIEKGNKQVAEAVEDLKPSIKEMEGPVSAMAKFLADMKGEKGDPGEDGKTPEKGSDYFTSEEIKAIVDEVMGMIRVPEDGEDGRDGRDGRDGQDGRNGKDAVVNYEKIISCVIGQIPKPKDGQDGRDGKDGNKITSKEIIEKIKGKFSYDDLLNAPQFRPQASRDYDLTELKDVNISAPTNGQVLVYNSTTRKWENGSGGGGTAINFADEETPTGDIDDVNVTFTLAHTPTTGSLKLYLGGVRLKKDADYTLSTATITMLSAPFTGAILLADYRY